MTDFATCHQENIRKLVTATRLSSFQDAANGGVGHHPYAMDRKPDIRHLSKN